MKSDKLKFSIIVPTYNEQKDIERTLRALEDIDWDNYEVIVVDDKSTDQTVDIVKKFIDRLPNFFLIRQSINRGVASARNVGIREATGDVVVILNADVILPKDFLKKLSNYYQRDNHWVAVLSRVFNQDKCYPRYIEAAYRYSYYIKKEHYVWTEGFSCTKKAAIGVGLFPEAMPGCSGEDVDFGLELERKYPGVKATDITVFHIAPDNLKEFWYQREGRGKGRTNYYYFVKHYNLLYLFINSLASSLWRVIKMFFLAPVIRAWCYSLCSSRKRKDFFPFIFVGYIEQLAMLVGIWKAFRRLL